MTTEQRGFRIVNIREQQVVSQNGELAVEYVITFELTEFGETQSFVVDTPEPNEIVANITPRIEARRLLADLGD